MSSENVLTPYEKVLAARKSDRPDIMKYIEVLFDDFIEMHGDRYYKDDKSLVAGIASFNGKTVTVSVYHKHFITKYICTAAKYK